MTVKRAFQPLPHLNAPAQLPRMPSANAGSLKPITSQTAKEHHRRAMTLEQEGNLSAASAAYHQASAAYSFLAITNEQEGKWIDSYTNHKNCAASHHNSIRIESDPKVRLISARAAIAEFERAARCASKIGALNEKFDQKGRSYSQEAECLEAAYIDCIKIEDKLRAKNNLLKAAVARINLSISLAHIGNSDESNRNIQTAYKYLGDAEEKQLQQRFGTCDTWEKIIEFCSELDITLSIERR